MIERAFFGSPECRGNLLNRMILGLFVGFLFAISSAVEAAVIYQTGFEASEGYSTNLDLAGQKGWVKDGTGGNGLVTGFFAGKGQQAYIGYTPPDTNDFLYLYQPLNQKLPQVQFSVRLMISDSTNTNYDNFYWSVYDQRVHELVAIDFDNYYLEVYYWTNGATLATPTGVYFTNGVAYTLSMNLDFAANLWSATLDGVTLATNMPITTFGTPLDLGDIDAGWIVYDTAAPGDNYMVFDDYRVTGTQPTSQIQLLGALGGAPVLHLSGPDNTSFAIDASTSLTNWTSLKTNTTTGGSFDYVDTTAIGLPARFYRGRWVPN
jgi:hypothetical protein